VRERELDVHYTTGLLVGRAYALAHDPTCDPHEAVHELTSLASEEPGALADAVDRFRQLTGRPSASAQEQGALRLLVAALDHVQCAAA
jgi:hypothetical protein